MCAKIFCQNNPISAQAENIRMQIKSNDHDTCVPVMGSTPKCPRFVPHHNDAITMSLQQDGARPGVGLQSPPFPPDWSVIEHLTDLLDPRSHQRVPVPVNINEFCTVLVEESPSFHV